ncbi:hypothetical protein [Bacillus sp. HSf4]|uniref:hypothetical protein n=1 Tax=Bacillus sp. HSf4 TaxID=3035514 RepID=UPI0024098512|nr:hypothetical protein [Bacillus sp. HSf4]WFA04422.1 hypothetical protein P3X63_17725 [Bacillus sp. HSf4]
MAESKRESIGKIKIDLDVSDAITGLKAVQREAKAATKALAELRDTAKKVGGIDDKYDEYIANVKEIAGEFYSADFALTNELIYRAYHLGKGCELFVRRCSGTSTSINALEKTFDDVKYLRRGTRYQSPDLSGKVVFADAGVSIPKEHRAKRIYRIASVEEHEFQSKTMPLGVTYTEATVAR